MVRPYQAGQDTNGKKRAHHRQVTKNGFTRINRKDLGYHAHYGKDNNIHFGVTQEPEQMLEQNGATALVG